jgi:hypothetical protein
VFNISKVEKRVNDKYNTKNNITDENAVFLAIKNHTSANTKSRINFSETDTMEYMTWLSGAFFCPRIKTNRISNVTAVKAHERVIISTGVILIPVIIIRRQPPDIMKIFRIRSRII